MKKVFMLPTYFVNSEYMHTIKSTAVVLLDFGAYLENDGDTWRGIIWRSNLPDLNLSCEILSGQVTDCGKLQSGIWVTS